MFADAEGMPAAYQHLRVRLRVKQTCLLSWGQKIDLVEELLDKPCRVFQSNRNLIIDVLLEVQTLFRDCVAIQSQIRSDSRSEAGKVERAVSRCDAFDSRLRKSANIMLKKTISFVEKTPEMLRRLQ